MADGHRAKGEFEQALAIQSELIRLNPDWPCFYTDRGITYLAMGNHDQALADLSEAIRLEPQYQEAYELRAKAYRACGDVPKAFGDELKIEELRGLATGGDTDGRGNAS